jgi:hypothetical protein
MILMIRRAIRAALAPPNRLNLLLADHKGVKATIALRTAHTSSQVLAWITQKKRRGHDEIR